MSNKNYKGSIELISGLTQKNNGDFPLMEANAIAFYEEELVDGELVTKEIRLPDKLKTVGISDTEKETLVQNAVTATLDSESYKALSGNVTQNAENISSLDSEMDTLKEQIEAAAGDNEKLIVLYSEKESKLYLYEKDDNGDITLEDGTKVFQLGETTIVGGGGASTGAVASYKLSLKPAGKTSFSILQGRDVALDYTISLQQRTGETDSDGNDIYETVTSEKVTYSIYKENIFQRNETQPTVKDGSLDITDLLSLGTNNFKVIASVSEDIITTDPETKEEITETVTTRSTARWTVNVIDMSLTVPDSVWEAAPKYGATSFLYTPIGALTKTIHFILDGKEIHTETTNLNGTSLTYTIPKQSHGVHTFEVYCEGTIEDEVISTDVYKYILMFIDSSSNEPIIRIKAPEKAEQYTTSTIYFNVFDPLDEIIDRVDIYEGETLKSTYTNITSAEQKWDYKPQEAGDKAITFKYGDKEASVSIEVAEFPYTISPTLGDLMVDFVPTGRTNQDIDYNIFKNNAFTTIVDEETGETTTEEIPMSWTFSDNFDWINGGWKTDENGDSYFCVKAGTSVDFNYNLFDKTNTIADKDVNGNYNVAGTGKEFKLVFKTSNVAQSDATWLKCMANASNGQPTGIEMKAHNAYVKSNFDTLEIPYSEEDIIEFDMNIVPITQFSATYEPEFTSKVIPMIMTYEDGTPVQPKVITNPATSFKQVSAVPISIGSEYCDVHIYRMKVYERYLSEAEILNNFIADARSGNEMSARYLRNQIYQTGMNKFKGDEEDLKALAEACPDLRIYLVSAPYFTNNKSDKVTGTTIKQFYYKNGKDSLYDNWVATGATHNGQGTSSNEYGYSGRNLEFNMKKTDFLLADNQTRVSKVPLTPTSVPTNYFNFKINIASSENANNALLQKRYDRYLPYTSLASKNNPKVKNTMEFYNCVVFIQETNEDLSTHREFNDTKIHFYGIGNIGDSKKTDSTRVNDKEDPNEFCVEIMDWIRPLSSFPADTMVNAMSFNVNPETEEKEYVWAKDENLGILYELIDGEYVLTSDTTVNYDKVYYVDILENDDFSEDFTYGWRYVQTEYEKGDKVDGVEITEDQAAALNKEFQAPLKQKWIDFYRFITRDLTTNGVEDAEKVAAWKAEFQDWFILDAALYYYLFTLRYTMVDNRAKNSFWHYGKCEDGKYRFDFWDYDNDTALGIDNAGKLEIPFGVEDADTDPEGAPYFRAHDSTFFVRVAKYFASEINNMWIRVEQNTELGNAFDSTNFINEFDEWQGQFPEELWRLDYERKYKRTYVGGEGSDWDNALPKIVEGAKVVEKRYLTEMMNGRKKYQRRQFERNQDFYMASKFYGSKNSSNLITLRGSGSSTSHTIPADYTLTLIPFSNMYINLHDGTNNFYHRRVYAGEVYSINLLDTINKLDLLYIRGASNLQSLGDLSLMYLQTATLGAGSKLKNIILGNAAENYSNGALKTLEIGSSNRLLEELDIRNLSNLESTDLPVTGIPSLKRVYAQGSNISTARFANNGLLEEAYLPATITQLQLRNLYFLKVLEIESLENLTDLTIDNCAGIDALTMINNSPNLNTLRVTNVNWRFDNTDLLNRLSNINSTLTGYVYLASARRAELDKYATLWPELVVECNENNIIPQHYIIFNNNGEEIYRELKDEGTVLSALDDPVLNGTIETPTKPNSEDGKLTYTYKEWISSTGQSFVGTRITTEDVIFNAVYTEEIRKYSVRWYEDDEKLKLLYETTEEEKVAWGGNIIYPKGIPTKAPVGNNYFLFEKWKQPSTNIVTDTDIIAQWTTSNPNLLGSVATEDLTATDIYALKQNNTLKDKFTTAGDVITVQMGYMPTYDGVSEEVLISEKTIFNGSSDYINTGIKLFDEDKSFTLALDYEMGYSTSTGYLVSCYSDRTNGFALRNVKDQTPKLCYKSTSTSAEVGFKAPTAAQTYREICVVRKIKGDNNLYVYSNNRYALDDIVENKLFITDTFAIIQNSLCFGALLSSSGSASQFAPGVIHYAKLWHGDIGADECKKVCSWIYENKEFEYVGSGFNYYAGTDTLTQATFVAKELLDDIISYNFSSRNDTWKGYGVSDLRKWLQKKPFLGVSLLWQQTINKSRIDSLLGAENSQQAPTGDLYLDDNGDFINDYFYIPSVADLSSTYAVAEFYEAESLKDENYPIFTDNASRVRVLSNSGKEWGYWTRTASMGTSSQHYIWGVAPTSDNRTAGEICKNYSINGQYYFFQSNNVSNNYKHGILLAFSI